MARKMPVEPMSTAVPSLTRETSTSQVSPAGSWEAKYQTTWPLMSTITAMGDMCSVWLLKFIRVHPGCIFSGRKRVSWGVPMAAGRAPVVKVTSPDTARWPSAASETARR